MKQDKTEQSLKNKTISGVVWKGLERVAAQLVSAIVSIVLARILIPDDYSVVSIVLIFFSFCNIFISGGLNTALIQKKDADAIDYSTILFTNLAMSLIFYLALFFTAPLVAGFFHKDILTPIIRVMSITFFINGYKAVLTSKVSSDMKFRKFFFSTLIGTIVSAPIGIVMAIKGFGPWALVAQYMTNTAIDSIVLTFTSKIKLKFAFSGKRFKPLFKYGWKIMLSSLINEVYEQANPLIVGIKYSAVDLAYYNKGKTYPDLISSIGNDTLSSSLFPAMSKIQTEKEKVLSMTRRFMQLASFLVFPLMIGFLAVADSFVRIVLTEKWLPIVPYLMIFCVANMMKPIQTGNLQAIRAIGRSDIFLKLEIIKKVSYFAIILLFVFFTHDPILLAVSSIITTILASLINSFPNRKLLGYSYKDQFNDIWLNFVTAALMGVTVYAMRNIPINIYALFALQIITGVVVYFGLSFIFENQSLFYFLKTTKDFFNSHRKAKIKVNRSSKRK